MRLFGHTWPEKAFYGEKPLLLVKRENVSYFQFPALNRFPGLMHAIGCRRGGESLRPFDGMNLGKDVGDDPESVTANRNLWRRVTGGGVHVYATQNHGTTIRVIPSERRYTRENVVTIPEPADALITSRPLAFLSIQTADCQSVLLYDPSNSVVANVHCGWRGSVAGLIARVVTRMHEAFGCRPDQMVAAIGPSLGPCCAEFIRYETEIPEAFWPYRIGTNHFDFWRISRYQLVSGRSSR